MHGATKNQIQGKAQPFFLQNNNEENKKRQMTMHPPFPTTTEKKLYAVILFVPGNKSSNALFDSR